MRSAFVAAIAMMLLAAPSQAVPDIVTNDNWESMVLKPAHDKDVIVLFYDLKSSSFKNIIRGVEAKFPKSSVVFAEYDITGKGPSDLPHPFKEIASDLAKTPALYLYRQGQEPERYTGSRMGSTIADWIKNHPHIKHEL